MPNVVRAALAVDAPEATEGERVCCRREVSPLRSSHTVRFMREAHLIT